MSGGEERDDGRAVSRWRGWLSAWWVPALAVLVFGVSLAVSIAQAPRTITPERHARIVARVLPKDGYNVPIKWGDLGPKLVRLGVIDLNKLKAVAKDQLPLPDLRRLEAPSDDPLTITTENQWLLVTVLWAAGLANKSPVLDRALAERGEKTVMGLASTGGWTLGTKPAAELYGKFDIIPLTPAQQALVMELAQSIHRPCCGNSTAFPDCNHGMALLGLIELMAAHNFGREEILKAALNFNAFWFPREYTRTALLFALRGVEWDAVDPWEILGARYSSLSGWAQNVDQQLAKVSHLLPPEAEGASCALPGVDTLIHDSEGGWDR